MTVKLIGFEHKKRCHEGQGRENQLNSNVAWQAPGKAVSLSLSYWSHGSTMGGVDEVAAGLVARDSWVQYVRDQQ